MVDLPLFMTLSTQYPYRSEVLHGTVSGQRALIWSRPSTARWSDQHHEYCPIPEGWELVESELCYVGLMDEEGHIWPLEWRILGSHMIETVTVEVGGAPYPWDQEASRCGGGSL